MLSKTKRTNNLMFTVFTNPRFFYILWVILLLVLLLHINKSFSGIVLGVCSCLIFTHVLCGGYFLFKKENHVNDMVVFLTALIYINLIFHVSSIGAPIRWFIFMQSAFICAILYHLYYKSRVSRLYLKEFCNYKIYVEIVGILFASFGLILYLLFPSSVDIIALVVLLSIIKFNMTVLRRKRLYRISYFDLPAPEKEQPFVSIVIIAYNEEKYIASLLDSITAQDYPGYEVILVDDRSTDKTSEIASTYTSRLPLTIVRKELRGAAGARNFGATFAQGPVILFLDADVILPQGFIRRNMGEFLRQKLSIAGADMIPITENRLDHLVTGFYRLWLRSVQYFNPRGIGFCFFVYKHLHDQVLFDESIVMSEDFDYVKRASEKGKFRIMRVLPIRVSWRRFHKENRFLLIMKYLFFEWYRQNIGEIRRKILPYEFGQ